jgi:hypothetical protein
MVGFTLMTPAEAKVLKESFPDIPSPSSSSSKYERWSNKWQDPKSEPSIVNGFARTYIAADSCHTFIQTSSLFWKYQHVDHHQVLATSVHFLHWNASRLMRSTMTEERLTGLALLHFHKDLPTDVDEVINRFALLGSHQLAFLWFFLLWTVDVVYL